MRIIAFHFNFNSLIISISKQIKHYLPTHYSIEYSVVDWPSPAHFKIDRLGTAQSYDK